MLFVSLWRIEYENRYATHLLYLNTFVTIEKIEPRNYDQNSITIDFSIIFFQKHYLDLLVTNRSLILEHLEKSWENMQNTITMQLLATYRKK